MLTTKEQVKREKIGEKVKKIKYRLYQAEIRFASHDNELLKDSMKRIITNAKRVIDLLSEKSAKKVFKGKKRRVGLLKGK